MSRSPNRARMAEAPGGLWHVPRSRELLPPERHFRDRPPVRVPVLAINDVTDIV